MPPDRRRSPIRVAVAIGSNLDDREGHVAWAAQRLADLLTGLRISQPERTAPYDVPDPQPDYVNAVAVGRTRLSPRALLHALLELERQRGRRRPSLRAARTLDLDLVFYGDVVLREEDLVVPHPRFRERDFVLRPLAALAPGWRDPVTGRTAAALWRIHQANASR